MLRVFFFILENAPFLFYIHHKVKKDIIIILGHVLLTTIHLQTKVIDWNMSKGASFNFNRDCSILLSTRSKNAICSPQKGWWKSLIHEWGSTFGICRVGNGPRWTTSEANTYTGKSSILVEGWDTVLFRRKLHPVVCIHGIGDTHRTLNSSVEFYPKCNGRNDKADIPRRKRKTAVESDFNNKKKK